MYNDIERCDNHIDLATTYGCLGEIFKGVLYGYYYEYEQCDDKPFLKFSLYFVTPFDNVYAHKYGDCNGSYKQEIKGFKDIVMREKTIELKNMQVVPLQYDDYYANDDEGYYKTRPKIITSFTTNIYKDERDKSFFERLLHKEPKEYALQVKELLDHNMFYKVTFEVPFDVIADYVKIDKILIEGATEKTKSLYVPQDLNLVDGLAKRLERVNSLMNEMESIIQNIRADPVKFKKDNTNCDWSEKCRTKGELNMEAAEFLFSKTKSDFEKMQSVLYGAMTWDINKEPKEVEDTKCSHDLCVRQREKSSKYCNKCIQLPTKECNFCEGDHH